MRLACSALLALAVVAAQAARASADESSDGLYTRWDEDLVLSVNAGGGVARAGDEARFVGLGELRLRFFGAAGPVVSGAWAPDAPTHVFVGAELRPLFPGLFLMDLSTYRPFVDLLVQSLSVELGAAFPLDGERSVGLGVGLALEVPLVYPHVFAQGLFLRLSARRVIAPASFQSVEAATGQSHWVLTAALSLAIGIDTGIENLETPRFR